jgi:hypothetical protein
VTHVDAEGWKGLRNGELLGLISGHFDALLTGDTNLHHQQNLGRFDVAVILIRTRHQLVHEFEAAVPAVLEALKTAPKGALTEIEPGPPAQAADGPSE